MQESRAQETPPYLNYIKAGLEERGSNAWQTLALCNQAGLSQGGGYKNYNKVKI